MIISPSTTNRLEVLRTTLLHNFSFMQNRLKTGFEQFFPSNSQDLSLVVTTLELNSPVNQQVNTISQFDSSEMPASTEELIKLELRLIVLSSHDVLRTIVNENNFKFTKNGNIAKARLDILDKIKNKPN